MFTNEKPPQDSSFHCENSQLGVSKSSNGDENPLPKFSIRDFVFQNRVSDLKKNWPFSRKNLQLCLKYEVEDVLPPFQSLDLLRKRGNSMKMAYDKKVAREVENTASFEFEEGEEFPSRARSKLVSALNSVSTISTQEMAEFVALKSNKSSIRSIDKKRRFPVADRDPVTKEDSAVNSSVASESMASQVCPVCKTFSSCSNTTLNAHIDQCLSMVPISNSQACEKAVKHKIKRRRIRLMTDIYETACCYTLEDLDRRNGTNWAANSEAVAEEHDKVHSSNICDKVGDVYFDSNGMKLRILSKLDGTRLEEKSNRGSEPTEHFDGEFVNKSLLAKKRKHLVQKLKPLRPATRKQGGCANSSSKQQISTRRLTRFSSDVSKKDLVKPLVDDDLTKTHKLGTLKNQLCSKQTSRKKRVIQDYENMDSTQMDSLKLKSVLPSDCDEVRRRNSSSKSASFSGEDHALASDSPETNSDSSYSYSDECLESLSVRKSVTFPLLKRRENKQPVLSKCIAKQSSKYNLSVHGRHEDSPYATQNLLSAARRKTNANASTSFKGDDKKFSPLEKSLICSSGSDEEGVLVSRSMVRKKGNFVETMNEHDGKTEKSFSTPSFGKSKLIKFRKKRLAPVNTYNESLTPEGLNTWDKPVVHCPGNKTDAGNKRADAFGFRDGERSKEFACEPIYHGARDASHSSYPEINGSFRCVVAYNPSDLLLNEGKKLCSESVTPNSQISVQNDDGLEAEKDSYTNVAPILIPGPPGCFLPSPGDGGPDEFQVNSSLTTCRIHSSDDEQETVDTGCLHSQGSAMAAPLPNSAAVAENLLVHSHAQYPTQVSILENRNSSVSADKEVSFRNFCSREDAALQNAPPNYPSSQFFRELAEHCDDYTSEDYCFISKPSSPHDAFRNPEAQQNASNLDLESTYPRVSSHSHSEAKLSALGSFKSSAEPASNPVLRLMGKNLMVISKFDNLSCQIEYSETSSIPDHCTAGVGAFNINSLMPNMKTNIPMPHIHCHPYDGYAHFQHPMISSNHTGLSGSLTFNGYDNANRSSILIPEQQLGSIMRPDACKTYDSDMVKFMAPMQSEAALVPRCGQVNALYAYMSMDHNPVSMKPHDSRFEPRTSQWNCGQKGSQVLDPRPSQYFPRGFS